MRAKWRKKKRKDQRGKQKMKREGERLRRGRNETKKGSKIGTNKWITSEERSSVEEKSFVKKKIWRRDRGRSMSLLIPRKKLLPEEEKKRRDREEMKVTKNIQESAENLDQVKCGRARK